MVTNQNKPLAIDLYAGLGGWTSGLLAEGWQVVGIDIEEHVYGEHRYPAGLIIQDVLTVDGRAFSGADLIVASPPCQEFSWLAMPWSRAKQVGRALRGADCFPAGYRGSRTIEDMTRLFDACFRIQREACEAAGRHIPLIVENVRGAQPWVGQSRWSFGSFHLWGDVPALMPATTKATKISGLRDGEFPPGGLAQGYIDGRKLAGFRFDGSGRSFQSASVEHTGVKAPGMNWSDRTKGERLSFTDIAGKHALSGQKGVGPKWDAEKGCGAHGMARWTNPAEGVKQHGSGAAWFDKALDERRREATAVKNGGDWFGSGENCSEQRRHGSKSNSRKAASAMIAKIPEPLARWIARCFYPRASEAA